MEIEKEIIDLRDRTARIETSIETLAKQQTAIDTLANSVQQLALSLKETAGETKQMSERLSSIENDEKKKSFYLWSTIVGGVLGAIIHYLFTMV